MGRLTLPRDPLNEFDQQVRPAEKPLLPIP